jgi:hypothetical protein
MEAEEKQCLFIKQCVILGDKKTCWVLGSFSSFKEWKFPWWGHELSWEWFFSHGKDEMGFPW